MMVFSCAGFSEPLSDEIASGVIATAEGDCPSRRLCDEHRTKECFAALHPFKPGIEIISSW